MDDIAKFMELRKVFQDELDSIQEQIDKLNIRKTELKALGLTPTKESTVKIRGGTLVDQLVEFIRSNPGCNRKDITAFLGPDVSRGTAQARLGSAHVKGRITNLGTRGQPRWYVIGDEPTMDKKEQEDDQS